MASASAAARFFSPTTDDKRTALDQAWACALNQSNGDLLGTLKTLEEEARCGINGGNVLSASSSNGHSGAFAAPGSGAFAPGEVPRMYRDLIDNYRRSNSFLVKCATYGLDAFCTKFNGFPCPLPAVVSPAVIVDSKGHWLDLVNEYGDDQITAPQVIGAAVAAPAVFLWMMDNLIALTQVGSDFGNLRLTGGLQYF